MADVLRVLIAEDHPLFRDGMHGLLDSVEATVTVGEEAAGRWTTWTGDLELAPQARATVSDPETGITRGQDVTQREERSEFMARKVREGQLLLRFWNAQANLQSLTL
jgi:hypothetical protein